MAETNTASSPAAGASAELPLDSRPDFAGELDRILWKYVHGQYAVPPPPGPNASGEDVEEGEDLPLPRVGGDSDGLASPG